MRIVADDVVSLNFIDAPKYKVNTDKPLTLITDTTNELESFTLEWSYSSTVSQAPNFLTPLTGSRSLVV